MRAPASVAGALALLALGTPSAAPAAPASGPPDSASPAPADPAPVVAEAEQRCDLLLVRLEGAIAAARGSSAVDPVALIEAEETAAVAEELLEEGEAEIAVELVEQAIALLPDAAPE